MGDLFAEPELEPELELEPALGGLLLLLQAARAVTESAATAPRDSVLLLQNQGR
jgi:hypothetical protein